MAREMAIKMLLPALRRTLADESCRHAHATKGWPHRAESLQGSVATHDLVWIVEDLYLMLGADCDIYWRFILVVTCMML
jgi:hypothetical protein